MDNYLMDRDTDIITEINFAHVLRNTPIYGDKFLCHALRLHQNSSPLAVYSFFDKSNKLLAATTPQAISPAKPPDWGATNVRTVPIVPKWRAFTWAETEALKTKAVEREVQSRNWHTAMDAVEKMERLDEKDHKRFRSYQGGVAQAELGKLTANSELAQKLHKMRPQYASISHGMESAEVQASRQITELSNKYKALMY